MLSKKYYVKFADILKYNMPDDVTMGQYVWNNIRQDVEELFSKDNKLFNLKKFREYINYQD